MKKYLFIGEERSELAKKMNVRWEDGRLAAKQLFDALEFCGLNPKNQKFINIFEPLHIQGIGKYGFGILNNERRDWIHSQMILGYKVVGMGKKVQKELDNLGIVKYIPIVHPAAKGKIRKKENYLNHVREQLK